SFVIDISDGLTARAADAGIVEEEVNWFALEFDSRRPDACKITHIHGLHPKLAAAPIRHSANLGSGAWIATSRVNLPAIRGTLPSELQPEPAIGAGDQGARHLLITP